MAIYIYDKSTKRLKEIYTDECFKIEDIRKLVSNQDSQGGHRKKKAPGFVSVDARTMYPLKIDGDSKEAENRGRQKGASK